MLLKVNCRLKELQEKTIVELNKGGFK